MLPTFTPAQLRWLLRHGLGNPYADPKCKGRRNGCVCDDCDATTHLIAAHDAAGTPAFTHAGELRPLEARRGPRQPWEPRPARASAA